jgi:hypothetical protein
LPRRLLAPVSIVRQMLEGDIAGQLKKVRLLFRHRQEHARLRESMVSFRAVLALLTAHRIGLLTALGDEPLSVEVLAAPCGIRPNAALTLLRILEAQEMVRLDGQKFRYTDFGSAFVASGGALTFSPLLELLGTFTGAFEELLSGMRAGKTPASLDIFSPQANPDAFLDAVNSYLDVAGRELLGRVELPKVSHLIVGSMGVSMSALLLRKFSDARVTYGCLPHLVERIPRLRQRYRVDSSRVAAMHHHGGDPDQDSWGGESFDLVLLTKKMILAPEQRVGERFARKAFRVLRPGGVLLLWEAVHQEGVRAELPLVTESFLDLAVSPTGCLITLGEMEQILRKIGFGEIERVSCLGGETTFLVARKGSA